MPVICWFVGVEFSDFVTWYDHWIAFILLVLIGEKMIHESMTAEPGDPGTELEHIREHQCPTRGEVEVG